MNSSKTTSENDHYLFIALLILIVWIPIPNASVEPWAYNLSGAITFSLLSLSLFTYWQSNTKLPAVISANKLPLYLLVAWLLFQFAQIVPLPEKLLEIISPTAKTVHDYAATGQTNSAFTLTITPADTLAELLKNCSYIAILFLVLLLTNSQKRLKLLAHLRRSALMCK